jgi:hypothetical protein
MRMASHVGLRTLANELVARVDKGQLPYVDGQRLRPTDELPLTARR